MAARGPRTEESSGIRGPYEGSAGSRKHGPGDWTTGTDARNARRAGSPRMAKVELVHACGGFVPQALDLVLELQLAAFQFLHPEGVGTGMGEFRLDLVLDGLLFLFQLGQRLGVHGGKSPLIQRATESDSATVSPGRRPRPRIAPPKFTVRRLSLRRLGSGEILRPAEERPKGRGADEPGREPAARSGARALQAGTPRPRRRDRRARRRPRLRPVA